MKRIMFAAISAAAAFATPAAATKFVYTYEGHLPVGAKLGTTTLARPTPFTFHAVFDDSSPNLAALVGVPGFVAYAPIRATLRTYGQTFDLKPWDGTSGVAVSIFDASTPFGPDHVASGFIQDVLGDGAGIVGDWLTSTPSPFDSSGRLQPFTMSRTDFFGVGFGAGVCNPICGTDPLPQTSTAAPTLSLVSGDFTYVDYQFVGPPFTPYRDLAVLAAPEPSAIALFGLGAVGIAFQRRRTR